MDAVDAVICVIFCADGRLALEDGSVGNVIGSGATVCGLTVDDDPRRTGVFDIRVPVSFKEDDRF
jgi:hypothetical protein